LEFILIIITVEELFFSEADNVTQLRAGIAKVSITSKEEKELINDSLNVKALVLKCGCEFKNRSPYDFTFVAGYSNGYIHYAPTAVQFLGGDYEDTNCLLGPDWQALYENKALKMLKAL
jgi:hypothetical protein